MSHSGPAGVPVGLPGHGPVGPVPALLHPERDSGVPMQSRRQTAGAVSLLPGPRSGN